jgi:hypothetical protein
MNVSAFIVLQKYLSSKIRMPLRSRVRSESPQGNPPACSFVCCWWLSFKISVTRGGEGKEGRREREKERGGEKGLGRRKGRRKE